MASSWSTPGLDPRYWVPRHRGGANVGFVDGRVAFSPNVLAEVNAGTIRVTKK